MIQLLLYPRQALGTLLHLLPSQRAGLTSLLPAGLSQAKAVEAVGGVCSPRGLPLVIRGALRCVVPTPFTYTAIEVSAHIERSVETRMRKVRVPIATQSPTWDSEGEQCFPRAVPLALFKTCIT